MSAVSDRNALADKDRSPCACPQTRQHKGLRGGHHKDTKMSTQQAERLIGMS